MKKIIFVLPAYNEELAIGDLLEKIKISMDKGNFAYLVLVVDDGSKDRTAAVVSSFIGTLPTKLIKHSVNKGLGAAIQTGLASALKVAIKNDVIVTMDADNTHDPSLVEKMVRKIYKGYDIVIASRYQRGGKQIGLSPLRKLMSFGARTFFEILFPIRRVKDYTCGYRAYKVSFLRKAINIFGKELVKERGFTCMVEILMKASVMGARISEVPMVLHYDYKRGKSKIKILKTIIAYFRLILDRKRFRLSNYSTAQGEIWDKLWTRKITQWDYLSQVILGILKKEIGHFENLKIIECGSGSGRISLKLAKKKAKVALLDLSSEAIKVSRSFFDEEKQSALFKVGSIFKIPFSKNLFDLAWSSGVFEHFSTPEQRLALREMGRVVKKGGLVIVINPYRGSFFYRFGKQISEKIGTWPFGKEVPVKTMSELSQDLKLVKEYSFGFFVIFVEGFRFFPLGQPITNLLRRLFLKLDSFTLFRKFDLIFAKIFGGYLLLSVFRKK